VLPINLRINQMIATPKLPPLIDRMITHARGILTLKQVASGSILIGGGWPGDGNVPTNKKTPRLESVVGNAAVAARIVPQLRDVEAIRTWAGFDGRTDDQLPIIGPVPGKENMLLASSCFGGYVAGPFIGKLIAQLIDTGEPQMSLEQFAIERFQSNPIAK
jgi:glycine/D-amino acid oxidase-like deaminating enzyme